MDMQAHTHTHLSSQDPIVFAILHLSQDKQWLWLVTRGLVTQVADVPLLMPSAIVPMFRSSRSEDEPMRDSAPASPDVTGALNFITN